jgi:hypothetical protein
MKKHFLSVISQLIMTLFVLIVITECAHAQANLVYGGTNPSIQRTPITINLINDFGATPNDGLDDGYALIKAAHFIENKWHSNGDTLLPSDLPNIDYNLHYVRLEIPSGIYNVGKEINLMTAPYDSLFLNATINPDTIDTLKFSAYYGSGNEQ